MASAPGWSVTVWLVPAVPLMDRAGIWDAIAACVVGGVSFTGGIGTISGDCNWCTASFTSSDGTLLTILGIDTNLQFIFEGIIILAAVTLDCLKYVQKK